MVMVASFFVLAGCSESHQDHFKSNQSVVSADYGIFYDGNLDDHVVTVHGFQGFYKCPLQNQFL
jgi:uncharacterized protein YcfL